MEPIEKLEKTLSEYIQSRIHDLSSEPISEVVDFVKSWGYMKYKKKEIIDYLLDKELIKETADTQAKYMIQMEYDHKETYNLSQEEIESRINEETLHFSGEKYNEKLNEAFEEWIGFEYESTKAACLTEPERMRKDMVLLILLLLY